MAPDKQGPADLLYFKRNFKGKLNGPYSPYGDFLQGQISKRIVPSNELFPKQSLTDGVLTVLD